MPNKKIIFGYIAERKSPALMVQGMDHAIVGACELGPKNEYVLVYSVQRILKILEHSGATQNQAVIKFEIDMKAKATGPGAPIFIDELTNE